MRCLLQSLLQPRPALPKDYSQPSHAKGLGKSESFGKKGDDSSSKLKTAGRPREGDTEQTRQPWVNHILVKGEKLALCMAYNSRPNRGGAPASIVSSFTSAVLLVRMVVHVAANMLLLEHKATPH